ncbi:MAG: two-component regulator propeller domain-containing protein, partial [Ignavibacteria bacterium]|nr:two-component regulator propeller domain-containing protein [Ignavibacteria bacterium]
ASKIILILFVSAISLLGQNFGKWKIYADMKTLSGTVAIGNDVWAATSGGAFKTGTVDSSFQIFTKADGLSSQNLTAIGIDAGSNIWFGSGEGHINILNPEKNTIEKILDVFNTSRTKKAINNIFVIGDSVIVSMDFGITVISAQKLSLLDSFLKLGNFSAEIKVLSTFKSKLFYVCTESGVAIQKSGAQNLSAPESWDNYVLSSGGKAVIPYKILQFNSDILLATSNGVYKFQNNNWSPFLLAGIKVVDMAVSNNSLLLISENTLYQYSNSQTTTLYANQSVTFRMLNPFQQAIYISTANGLLEYKNNNARMILPSSPASNSFLNMAIAPNGSVWIATGKDATGKGFFEFDGEKWNIFNMQNYPQLVSNAIYNLSVGTDSTVYLGTWGQGAVFYKKGKFDVFNTTNSGMVGIPDNDKFLVISDLKQDSKGNVWFMNAWSGVGKPLSVYTQDKKWYHYSFTNPVISTDDILDKMVIDENGIKWFFSIKGNRGIYYFNDKGTLDNTLDDTQGYLSKSDGLSSDLISSLAVDRRGQLWIGTDIGVNMISDPTRPKTTLSTLVGLSVRNQTVNCIAVDPIDQKWIGTNNGVFVLSSDGYQLINYFNAKNSPLPDNNVMSIAIDSKSGKVYLGTDFGLAELSTSFIEPKESFENLYIYPNPFVIGKEESSVTIDGLIRNSSIKILSVTGDLIASFETPGGKIGFWNGKDSDGNFVSSGVYFIVAFDEEGNNIKTSKVAVIRK